MFNVLLVDDEPIVKIALRTMIDWDQLGFPICGTASDGVEALALVKELNPDIIITDLKMPNMNGLQLIRALNESGYKGKIIVASNFGEYEMVREALLLGAVDYVLKISIQMDALIEQLQKTAKLLQEERRTLEEQVTREQTMRNNLKSVKAALLKDYFNNSYYELEYLTRNHEIQLNLLDKPFYLFYISLDGTAYSSMQKFNLTMPFIENMILDLIEVQQDIEVFQVEVNAIVVLVTTECLTKLHFDPLSFVKRFQKLMELYMTMVPIIVYSSEISGYEQARPSFMDCKDALDIIFYESLTVVCSSDVKFKHDIEFVNYVDFSNSILQYLYKKDHAPILDIMQGFIEQAWLNRVHPFAVKGFIHKCLDYLPLCDPKVVVVDSANYDGHIQRVSECISSEELVSIVMEAFACLSIWNDAPHSPRVVDSSVTKKEIVDVVNYVEAHYRDKITLEMIADQVNFSENYLCRVFRDQMGMSLIHYINNVRLNKAAELLMKGNTYIKEIANSVGIGDQFYFSRMFKKQFGVSPTDYKNHVSQNNQHK